MITSRSLWGSRLRGGSEGWMVGVVGVCVYDGLGCGEFEVVLELVVPFTVLVKIDISHLPRYLVPCCKHYCYALSFLRLSGDTGILFFVCTFHAGSNYAPYNADKAIYDFRGEWARISYSKIMILPSHSFTLKHEIQ